MTDDNRDAFRAAMLAVVQGMQRNINEIDEVVRCIQVQVANVSSEAVNAGRLADRESDLTARLDIARREIKKLDESISAAIAVARIAGLVI